MSYEEVASEWNKGLSLDIIATRDILPGEEIFFNYGQEWEDAWNNHAKSFNPDMEEAYASSTLMNIESQPIRTIEEQKTNPYAENIITMCYYDEDVELTHGLDKDNTITYLSD